MDSLYIIQNQHQLFLNKQGEWVDGRESQTLYRTAHKDEAINVKVEHAVRNPELRLTILPVNTNEKGLLQLNAPNSSLDIDSSTEHSFTQDSETARSNDSEAVADNSN